MKKSPYNNTPPYIKDEKTINFIKNEKFDKVKWISEASKNILIEIVTKEIRYCELSQSKNVSQTWIRTSFLKNTKRIAYLLQKFGENNELLYADLDSYSLHSLANADCCSIEKLRFLSDKEMSIIRGIGKKALNILRDIKEKKEYDKWIFRPHHEILNEILSAKNEIKNSILKKISTLKQEILYESIGETREHSWIKTIEEIEIYIKNWI